ncbi:MAG: S1 RNA-binding domain-containing protein, partial [Desulfobacterota bacterium]|nr:S1 RNA-binding domain-containing protein [Thermodesulfobacteriota bacterium]
IEGLIHISEISWNKKIRHPSQVVALNDMIEAVVLSVEPSKKRISLGIKQLEPNPWDIVKEKYPVGTVIEGTIKNITEFGIFIGLDEGIDGLIHISDISWTKKIKHPGELYKKGQKIRAIVLNIDEKQERFSLGVKQLEKDPWEGIAQRYSPGEIVEGKVTNITDFGIFLELAEGIEGLVHVSEVPKEAAGKLSDFVKIGDVISALIMHIDEAERKIGLSLKGLEKKVEEEETKKYLQEQATPATSLEEVLEAKPNSLGKPKAEVTEINLPESSEESKSSEGDSE